MISLRAKLGLLASLLFIAGVTSASGAGIQIPDGPGANLVYGKCQTCHDLQYVVDGKGLLAAQWKAVLASMKDYGLEISDQEKDELEKYLSTYLGPNPPPAASAAATPPGKTDGKTVYQENCAACHGDTGAGQPGSFPPLFGNPDLFKDRVFPALVVLYGMSGPITVEGRSYNGSMPPFGHLSDAEIAAVVGYIRGAGQQSKASPVKPVTLELIAQQRKDSLSPSQVHARRQKMETK